MNGAAAAAADPLIKFRDGPLGRRAGLLGGADVAVTPGFV